MHTVELEADSLYAAVVLGVAALREHDCDPGDVSQIAVEVRKKAKHSLTLRRSGVVIGRKQKPQGSIPEGAITRIVIGAHDDGQQE